MKPADPVSRAFELFQEAYQKQMSGELDAAVDLYKKSIEIHATAEAHTFLGWTYSFRGEVDAAISECHRAIAVDPDFGNPYNDIGAYLIEKELFDDAIPWLKKATVAKRYDAPHYAWFNLGRVHERRGRWAEASHAYRKALEIAAGYPPAAAALSRIAGAFN